MHSSYTSQNKATQAASSFFEIEALEELGKNKIEKIPRLHSIQYYEMIWILEGSGYHIINGQKYLLENRSMHCTIPGQMQQLSLDDGIKGYLISFNEAFLNYCYQDFNGIQEVSFFRMFSQNPVLKFPGEKSKDMEELALKLLKENENQFLLKNEVLSKYLKIFFIYVRRQFEEIAPKPTINNNIVYNNFLWLLENNFKHKKAVADYARDLSITPTYLNCVIKKISGYPASHHIQQRIILEAKRRVTHTGSSMKEIAYYLGFNDIYHFSKFFKTSAGMNFSAFKNSSGEVRT